MKALETLLQLNLSTGEIEEVPVQKEITITAYFNTLCILNKSAHIYNCVYLATPAALCLLEGV